MATAITNEQFLETIFGPGWQDAHVCGFVEDPAKVARGKWLGDRWGRTKRIEREGFERGNAYFAISTFRDEAGTGRARRLAGLFERCRVIVVDDVGQKVVAGAGLELLPAPSWRLETSAGNEQWGYLIEGPGTQDARQVSALLDGMARAGLTDPGSKNVTRLMRLPVSRNMKAKCGVGGWQCVLREWEPGRRFRVEGLAAGWGIALGVTPGSSISTGTGCAGADTGVDARPLAGGVADDEVLSGLRRLGRVLGGPGAGGWWDVRCPWIEEHGPDAAETGAAYHCESVAEGRTGGFKCHHGHCVAAGRGWRDVERWVHDALGPFDGLPAWSFGVVDGYVGLGRHQATVAPSGSRPGTAGTASPGVLPAPSASGVVGRLAEARFFDELVFVKAEGLWFSLRSRDLQTRATVDLDWTRELKRVLPVVTKGGVPLAPSAWFADEDNRHRARMADRLMYWPGRETWFEDGGVVFVNTWEPGLRDEAAALVGVRDDEDGVREWLALVALVCSRELAAVREALLDWMALVVAEPGTKPGWHVIVQGKQGLGKDLMAAPMEWGVGSRNIGRPTAKSLHGDFNPWAAARLVRGAEFRMSTVGASNGHDQYNTIKALTENTSEWVRINQKNQKEYDARNVSAWYVTSNEDRAVALDEDDRRFMVVMAGDVAPWGRAATDRLAKWMRAGGAGHCAEWLRARWEREIAVDPDRRDALLARAPGSRGKIEMIRATEDQVKSWARGQIEDGTWPDLMTGREVAAAVKVEFKGVDGRRVAAILRELGAVYVNDGKLVRLKSGIKAYVWAIREPKRFDGMGAPQIAQAYLSAAGHAFKDGDDDKTVIPFPDGKDDTHKPK